jgi:HK97 family phage major capsid protein
MIIKLLKVYGEFGIGDEVETKTDADGQKLIDEGIAEKVEQEPVDLTKVAAKIADEVKAELKKETKAEKIPAQPIDSDKPKHDFKSFGHFAQAVKQGISDPHLNAYCKSSGMNIAINADGGFLIPPEYSSALLTAMAQAGVIAPKCRDFPVNNNLALPFVNNTTQATSWTGGVTVYKPAEGIAKTTSLPQFGKAELHLHKMTAVIYATEELLADSAVALETFLTTMVSTEFALTKDEDIINGSGAGEALGIINAPCLVSVAKETDQPADTIYTDNVLKMVSRLYGPSLNNAVWLIAKDAMPQIGVLSIPVGTGGSAVFIADIKNALNPSLLGIPIIWSPHCQTIGDKGDIVLADFSQYITISKAGQGMQTATSIHLKFLEDEVAFRFVMRCDGQPWWASAITPKHGSNTVSPFVTLDERA